MSFGVYAIGFAIMLGGLIFTAHIWCTCPHIGLSWARSYSSELGFCRA